MSKFFQSSFCLVAVLVFCWPITAPAQEPVMPPLPPSDLANPEPPELDALPAPPQLEWGSLGPKGEDDQSIGMEPVDVPPPKPEASAAPPPPPVIETPLPGGADPAEVELVKPEVEIWRGDSEWPQIPDRRSSKLDLAYVTGTEPVWLRAQFSPYAAGNTVYVRPGKGITLNPPGAVLTVSSNGECLVLAQLAEGVDQTYIAFYCQGMKTILPVQRASLTTVISAEEETGGGH